jgi:hypothetical protein
VEAYLTPAERAASAAAEVARGLQAVPAHGLRHYGGAGAPFARAYLHRLADTMVGRDEAMFAAAALASQDNYFRALDAWQPGPAPASPAPQRAPRPQFRRPEPPGPGMSPVPRP